MGRFTPKRGILAAVEAATKAARADRISSIRARLADAKRHMDFEHRLWQAEQLLRKERKEPQ